MADAPPPSPAYLAELARQGEAIRREMERVVEDALRAIAGDPTLPPESARDVAEYLRLRGRAPREPGAAAPP